MPCSVHVHRKASIKVIGVCIVCLLLLSSLCISSFAVDYVNVINNTGHTITLSGTSFNNGDGAIMYSSPVGMVYPAGTVLIAITGYRGFSSPITFEADTEIIFSPGEYDGFYNTVYTWLVYTEYDSDRNFIANITADCNIHTLTKISNEKVIGEAEAYLTWQEAYNAGANYYKGLYEASLNSGAKIDVDDARGFFRDGISGALGVWTSILQISVLGIPIVSIMATFGLLALVFALVKVVKR